MTDLSPRSLHPAFKEALDEGVRGHASKAKAVRVLSKVVADTMEEMHGGKWRVEIDHEAGFVLVAPSFAEEERS